MRLKHWDKGEGHQYQHLIEKYSVICVHATRDGNCNYILVQSCPLSPYYVFRWLYVQVLTSKCHQLFLCYTHEDFAPGRQNTNML